MTDLVRRVVLASAAPKGADGIHGWAPQVVGAVGTPQTKPEEYLNVFFASSPASRQTGQEALGRMYSRTEDRDTSTTWAVREAQYDAVCTWGIPDHAAVKIYPDAAHGFLFQHHAEFAADVARFLDEPESRA
jgi:hypothetical protein